MNKLCSIYSMTDAVYIKWRMKYIFYGGCSISSPVNDIGLEYGFSDDWIIGG